MRIASLTFMALALGLAGPARAQAPQKAVPQVAPQVAPQVPSQVTPQVTLDPARLAAAKAVVARAQGDRDTTLQAMTAPMTAMVQQMGLKQPDRAKVMVQEVIMPILSEHYDELLNLQAISFAAVLSKADLEAIAAFYDTPAGRNMAKAQPQLAQAQLTGMQHWIGSLAGEMQAKLAATAEAHGWVPGGNKPKPN
ncbi:DUF2059 domain-containing protein [Methylobacterium sp. E-025]|uniref:DUF2059 domain-containing protein n=1 Tax=Methylobacterium sp. E-025 TaxID=2836561 RepID=UPI001FBC1385|nr:DUF2059 domain-containing protein [Methylobacterium sp. E-025]MCJ2114816.1 DUF2059 domain-containing protein [Methylobacterium sp. E-025]